MCTLISVVKCKIVNSFSEDPFCLNIPKSDIAPGTSLLAKVRI